MDLKLALLAAAALMGCRQEECTDMSCVDGVEVFFQKDSWDAGTYMVEIEADGQVISCFGTIPIVAGDGSGCDTAGATLYMSDGSLPVEEQSLDGFLLARTGLPEVLIAIYRGKELLAYENFQPTYETLTPNGEDCGPVCEYASYDLQIE